MGHVRTEVSIDAPIDHVWDLAMKIDRIPDYNPYMDLKGFTGPLDKVGTTFQSTMRVLGQFRNSTGTVAEVRPKEFLRLTSTETGGEKAEWTYRFQSIGQKTNITLDVDYEIGAGAVGGLIDRVYFERWLGQVIRHMGENFKTLAEATVLQPA